MCIRDSFLLPLLATARVGFSAPGHVVSLKALRGVTAQPRFSTTLWLSVKLALATTVASLVLMVPTLVWLHLRAPRWRSAVELVSVLPYVVPPIAMVAGVTKAFHTFLTQVVTTDYGLVPVYVVLAVPFTYRSLDAGLRAIDLRTLTEAARNLGATGPRSLVSVILPNIATAVLGAAFLTIAVVLGEYTIASLLLRDTFPIFLAQVGGNEPRGAPALALLAIAFTWALLGLVALASRRRRGAFTSAAAP